jgi:PAS domain S-box-containing protein
MKKTSKQELEALFEHAPVAIFITDDIGHCVWSNTTAQKLLGYTESELIEKSIFELIIPSERMRMIEEGAKNAGKNDYRGDWTLSSKKGDHIFTEVHSKKLQI